MRGGSYHLREPPGDRATRGRAWLKRKLIEKLVEKLVEPATGL